MNFEIINKLYEQLSVRSKNIIAELGGIEALMDYKTHRGRTAYK